MCVCVCVCVSVCVCVLPSRGAAGELAIKGLAVSRALRPPFLRTQGHSDTPQARAQEGREDRLSHGALMLTSKAKGAPGGLPPPRT